MKTEHTPAPWTAHPINQYSKQPIWGIIGEGGRITDIPELVPNHSPSEQAANAKLIAAAPDLLAALEAAIPALQRLGDFVGNTDSSGASGLGVIDRCAIIGNALAAIATAKGEK